MDLKLNDDQVILKKVAADFVKAEAPSYVITEWFQKKLRLSLNCTKRPLRSDGWE